LKLADIPGYADAVKQERFIRTAAFAPILERVCGVLVNPLTFQHLAMLETCGSPFVCGGPISIMDVGAFLWIVSPEYCKSKWKRKRFLRRVGKLRYVFPSPLPPDFHPGRYTLERAVHEVFDYISEAERDLPGSSGGRGGPGYYSIPAVIVDTIASAYGWGESYIMQTPIKRLLQYRNRIMERNGAGTLFNPSDAVRQRWLDANQN
jgi:hypothetical protein